VAHQENLLELIVEIGDTAEDKKKKKGVLKNFFDTLKTMDMLERFSFSISKIERNKELSSMNEFIEKSKTLKDLKIHIKESLALDSWLFSRFFLALKSCNTLQKLDLKLRGSLGETNQNHFIKWVKEKRNQILVQAELQNVKLWPAQYY